LYYVTPLQVDTAALGTAHEKSVAAADEAANSRTGKLLSMRGLNINALTSFSFSSSSSSSSTSSSSSSSSSLSLSSSSSSSSSLGAFAVHSHSIPAVVTSPPTQFLI
jgi:hypothetical protein